jgi:hypothetical protein
LAFIGLYIDSYLKMTGFGPGIILAVITGIYSSRLGDWCSNKKKYFKENKQELLY